MRIVSGKYKGRRFDPPHNITARPTTDFAKESLFNVLNNMLDFEQLTALDLFSGTGSISLELASRGCPQIYSIEQSERHLAFIRKTMKELGVSEITPLKADVFRYVESTDLKFDFIFADPPYALPELKDLPDLIFKKSLLVDDGLFVLEHPKNYDFSQHPHFVQHRHYGNVNFSFFK